MSRMFQATLCLPVRGAPIRSVLLGYKKNGFGQGKYTGFGGKVEPGETIRQAAARELVEEAGITAAVQDLQPAGQLAFLFPDRPEWSQEVHVFVVRNWLGEVTESREMRPAWFPVDQVPYGTMWADGSHWLPRILEGKTVQARFVFATDNQSLIEVKFHPD